MLIGYYFCLSKYTFIWCKLLLIEQYILGSLFYTFLQLRFLFLDDCYLGILPVFARWRNMKNSRESCTWRHTAMFCFLDFKETCAEAAKAAWLVARYLPLLFAARYLPLLFAARYWPLLFDARIPRCLLTVGVPRDPCICIFLFQTER